MKRIGQKVAKIEPENVIVLFYLVASYYITRVHFLLGREYAPARLPDLALGKASLPFQFRMLIPYTVRFIATLTKSDLLPMYATVEYILVFALFLAYRDFLRLFFNKPLSDIFPFVLLYVIPFNYGILTTMFYPSDFPAILFFVLALIAMYKKDWQTYYLVFALGTFNRETTCFLTFIFFAVFFKRMRTQQFLFHLVAQTLIWFAIKQILVLMFKNNPGGLYEDHISANIKMFLEIFSFKIYPLVNLLLNFGGLWILTIFGYKYAPEFLRRSLFVLVPFLIGMFLVGNLYEMRIYGELIPIVITIGLYPISRLFEKTR